MKDGFDVHDYKRRMELAVIKLKENKRVDPHNRIKIFRFLDFAETQGLSLPRRIRYLQNLTKLAAMLGRTEFQKATRTDIERILLEHGRLKWIKTTLKNNHKLLPEDLLTEQEVMELVRVAEWSRDRAFVSMLYDLGGRAGELLSLQRRNISFDDHGAVAILEGKTGQRRERLILSVPFLAAWLEEHPDKTPDAPLWIHSKQGCHEDGIVPMDYYSARRLLQRLEAKTKIEKRVNPQAFRHARATHLASILTEAQMKEYFGWTQGSRMPGRYVHLSGRDVDSTLLRAHGLQPRTEEEAPKLTVAKCVRCGLQNSTIHKLCSRCGMPLDLKTALEMKENLSKKSDEEMQKMRDELDELRFPVRLLQDASGYRVEPAKHSVNRAHAGRSSYP